MKPTTASGAERRARARHGAVTSAWRGRTGAPAWIISGLPGRCGGGSAARSSESVTNTERERGHSGRHEQEVRRENRDDEDERSAIAAASSAASVEDPDRRAEREHVHGDEARRGRSHEIVGAADPGDERRRGSPTPTIPIATSGRRGMLRSRAPAPSELRQRPVVGKGGRELGGAADVDVHRPHRQRDREHRRGVAPGPAEADGDQIRQRDPRAVRRRSRRSSPPRGRCRRT